MTKLDVCRTELQGFITDVGEGVARRLDLLRDIEHTILWLDRLCDYLDGETRYAKGFEAALLEGEIDPDGLVEDALQRSAEALKIAHGLLVDKRQSGRDDHDLQDDDGVEDAYTRAIAAIADLHNAMGQLRESIGEHDIDVAPRFGPEYTSVEDLIESLHRP